MTESKILANTLNSARQLTHFYLQHAKDIDADKRFTIADFTTHNISWLIAHLTWSENFLILKGVGNHGIDKEWFNYFHIGSEHPGKEKFPPFDETLSAFNNVHLLSIELLNNLPDNVLDEKNNVGLEFNNGDTKRILINHCIRHEGLHCGQLAWLLRMHGKKVI